MLRRRLGQGMNKVERKDTGESRREASAAVDVVMASIPPDSSSQLQVSKAEMVGPPSSSCQIDRMWVHLK